MTDNARKHNPDTFSFNFDHSAWPVMTPVQIRPGVNVLALRAEDVGIYPIRSETDVRGIAMIATVSPAMASYIPLDPESARNLADMLNRAADHVERQIMADMPVYGAKKGEGGTDG